MRKVLVIVAALMVAATTLGFAGSPASARPQSDHPFAAGIVRLSGAEEVPPADPDGRGTFGYFAAGNKLCYFLTVRRIDPAIAAHIHAAPRGVNGGIVIGLDTPTDGFSFDCITAVSNDTPNSIMVLLQSELDAIIADPAGFYTNVHTAPFPAGAVRGQLR